MVASSVCVCVISLLCFLPRFGLVRLSSENRRENMRETEVEGETDVRGAEACQNLLSDFSYKSVACKMTTTNFCGNI
jgi:hypothetical protein